MLIGRFRLELPQDQGKDLKLQLGVTLRPAADQHIVCIPRVGA